MIKTYQSILFAFKRSLILNIQVIQLMGDKIIFSLLDDPNTMCQGSSSVIN